MIDNNNNILNINTFTKLIRIAQDFSNFENYKTLFLYDFYLAK